MAPRKYQVFVSSTFHRMEAVRKAAVAGISDAHHVPIALDSFAPENSSDLDVIRREVNACHVYVLLLGPNYGASPKDSNSSYTEIEYDLALSAGRYILAFTLAWEDIVARRKELDPARDATELSNTTRLRRFYDRVSGGSHFHRHWRWNDTEAVRRFISLALAELPYKEKAPKGLVPEADVWPDLVDSIARNEFVRDTVTAIKSFDKLYERTTTNVEGKIRAAEFLAECYHARMESMATRGVFFESGSSIAFFAKALPDTLWQRVRYGEHGDPHTQITTNNALVYLHLWLTKGVPCAQFPWGKPDKTYGASYGPVGLLGPREPNYRSEPLNNRAKTAIKSLQSARLALRPENTSLIIMATSGLQLSGSHQVRTDPEYSLPKEVRSSVSCCFGPHVGSYNNKVFKRYLLETSIPTIILVDSSKIDCPIDVRKCHFICDTELPWETVLAEHPLAVCVGGPIAILDKTRRVIEEAIPACEILTSNPTRPYCALIARTQAFKKQFGQDAELVQLR